MDNALIGQIIDGRFEIRAKIGQGGMGAVYRAWQKSVDREVAIKLMHRGFSSDPMAAHRFEREARLASKLSQPNTVSIFDFGTTSDGQLFLAMELIKGRTLHRVLDEGGPFPIERAVRVGTQICDALEAAHGLGIVHRDLKLENVIVLDEPPGRDLVKVLDFGLAKYEGDLRGTAAGIVVGTPRYMAPEVSTAGQAVAASDLYALGVMLAELVMGASPWRGDSLAELLVIKMNPGPAIAGVPGPLRGLVGALLEASPQRRPTAAQTRQWLAAAGGSGSFVPPAGPIEAVTVPGKAASAPRRDEATLPNRSPASHPVAYPPPPWHVQPQPAGPHRRARWPWFVAGGGVLAIAGIALALWLPLRDDAKKADAEAPPPRPRESADKPAPAPVPEPKTEPKTEPAPAPAHPAKTPAKKAGPKDCRNTPPTSITDEECVRVYCENHPMDCANKFGNNPPLDVNF